MIEDAKAPEDEGKGKGKGKKMEEEDEENEPAVKRAKVKVKNVVDDKDDNKEEEVGESSNEGGNLSKPDSPKLQKNGVISDSDED